MVIKSLQDAEEFIKDFKKYAEVEPNNGNYIFSFENESSYGKATTEIIYNELGEFHHYNYGRGWKDRSSDHIDTPVRFFYERRKRINAEFKKRNKAKYY